MKQITITGNLLKDARVISNEDGKGGFIAFSIGTKGEENDWVDVTQNFNDEPPGTLKYLNKGQSVLIIGKPYAKLVPATEQYEAKAVLAVYANRIELQ